MIGYIIIYKMTPSHIYYRGNIFPEKLENWTKGSRVPLLPYTTKYMLIFLVMKFRRF